MFHELRIRNDKEGGPVRGVGGGGGLCPRLNFKPLYVAISEGSHVAVGISSKATDIDIGNV